MNIFVTIFSNIDFLTQQLDASFAKYRDLSLCLASFASVGSDDDLFYRILNRFKLNEAIIGPTLVLLCKHQRSNIDDRLAQALEFYSDFESNENVRLLAANAIVHLDRSLLPQIPSVIFNILLDDSEEIRLLGCKLVAPENTSNLLCSLEAFAEESGAAFFREFLNRKISAKNSESCASNSLVLFEKEPLNAFLDVYWLDYTFNQK